MALKTTNLGAGYPARVLCANVSLSFAPGFHALVGRNGTGKSTFLKTIAHLSAPLTGSVSWQNQDLAKLTVLERSRLVSWLQAEETVPFAYAVEDLLLMGRHPWHGGRPQAKDRTRAREALERLEMGALAPRRIHELSTGERQLVRVARALTSDAPVWLWDEPLRSLDCHHQIMVLRLLKEEAAAGRVLLVALHELEWAMRAADHFLVFGLSQGLLGPLSPQDFASPALWWDAFQLRARPRGDGSRPGLDIEKSF